MEEDKELDIPRSHTAVRENNEFMDKLALMRVEHHWSERDLMDFLEAKGYRPETINRFNRGVNIRLSKFNHKEERRQRHKKQPAAQTSSPMEENQGGEESIGKS